MLRSLQSAFQNDISVLIPILKNQRHLNIFSNVTLVGSRAALVKVMYYLEQQLEVICLCGQSDTSTRTRRIKKITGNEQIKMANFNIKSTCAN
jgi:hypothetical protein